MFFEDFRKDTSVFFDPKRSTPLFFEGFLKAALVYLDSGIGEA